MRRLPINQDFRAFLKSIEGDAAMVLILMLGMYPTPVNADHLTFEMKWDARNSRSKKVLDNLSAEGFTVLMKGQGYVLTSPALRLVAEFFQPIFMKLFEGVEISDGKNQKDLALSPALEAGTEIKDQALVIDVLPSENTESEQKISTQNARALLKKLEEEDSLNLIKEDSSSSDSDAQNVRGVESVVEGLTTEKVLKSTPMLEGFGDDGVYLDGLNHENIYPHHALAWVAQAYHDRNKLENPAGLVHSRLRNPNKPQPRPKFQHGWMDILPDDFLCEIGYIQMECSVCGQKFDSYKEFHDHEVRTMKCTYFGCDEKFHDFEKFEAHEEEHAKNKNKTLTEAVGAEIYPALDESHRGAKAWKLVKDELQADMPRASFDTWVRDAEAVALENLVLTVAVRNAYARDWLESRLLHKVNVMLKKFTQENMTVKFVVGSVEGDDETIESR